jgi:hypothetical protein
LALSAIRPIPSGIALPALYVCADSNAGVKEIDSYPKLFDLRASEKHRGDVTSSRQFS